MTYDHRRSESSIPVAGIRGYPFHPTDLPSPESMDFVCRWLYEQNCKRNRDAYSHRTLQSSMSIRGHWYLRYHHSKASFRRDASLHPMTLPIRMGLTTLANRLLDNRHIRLTWWGASYASFHLTGQRSRPTISHVRSCVRASINKEASLNLIQKLLS